MALFLKLFEHKEPYQTLAEVNGGGVPSKCVVYIADRAKTIYHDTETQEDLSDFLCISTIGSEPSMVSMEISVDENEVLPVEIEYTLDNGDEWIEWDFSEVAVPFLKEMRLRGNCPYGTATQGGSSYCRFNITNDGVDVYGSPHSLLGKSRRNTTTLLANGENENVYHDISFHKLFANNDKILDSDGILLPANTLSENCYGMMFYGCSLMGGTLYKLPALNLAKMCYNGMFAHTDIDRAPELMAETSAPLAYQYMFNGCKDVNSVTMHIVESNPYESGDNLCNGMLQGVADEGTLYVPESDIADYFTETVCPTGWTVSFIE